MTEEERKTKAVSDAVDRMIEKAKQEDPDYERHMSKIYYAPYTEEEGAKLIKMYEDMPDECFPMHFEKNDGSGYVYRSRQEMIDRIRASIKRGYRR